MHILIAGGTGFVGHALVPHLLRQSHTVTVLGRKRKKIQRLFENSVNSVDWEQFNINPQKYLANVDVVINLCGENVAHKRWTKQRKAAILHSRVSTTRKLVNACCQCKHKITLFNASAIGVYGLHSPKREEIAPTSTEDTPINFDVYPDFLAFVAREWEKATLPAKKQGIRVVNLRFGVVLDKAGGALKQMLLPYKLYLGGKIANGRQMMSWVTIADILKAIDFLLIETDISGPVNIVSPHATSQAEFAYFLARALHRPCKLTLPAWFIRLLYRQMGNELLLKGQHVYPKKLLQHQFNFQHPTISQALKHAIQ